MCREEDITGNKRVQAVLREIRKRAGDRKDEAGNTVVAAADWPAYKVHIVSKNTFPTAAGLASSAAGYACLTRALADLYAVEESYKGELTTIARMGSGSACRSLHGGFVRWSMGSKEDGSDSMAVQVAPEGHWPELRVLIAVVSDKKKDTGSTAGMVASVNTSPLLGFRAREVVQPRLEAIGKPLCVCVRSAHYCSTPTCSLLQKPPSRQKTLRRSARSPCRTATSSMQHAWIRTLPFST